MRRAVLVLRTLDGKHQRSSSIALPKLLKRRLCGEAKKPLENGEKHAKEKAAEVKSQSADNSEPPKASTFSAYTQAINHSIGDIEKVLMERIHESNQRRFRIMFFSSAAFIITLVVVFGETISKKIRSLTTGLALETLEDKSIKIQTQELAMAVVQTVLNDKDVTAQAASFLREAAQSPETQEALLKLTLHVLQHPDSIDQLTTLTQNVLSRLANDKQAVENIAVLLGEVFENPLIVSTLSKVVSELCEEEEVLEAVSELMGKVAEQPNVAQNLNKLLENSASHVLEDEEISERAREFVQDVMRDDRLQREGGDAIWNSVYHATVPGAVRLVGFGLICASVGLGSLMLSPF